MKKGLTSKILAGALAFVVGMSVGANFSNKKAEQKETQPVQVVESELKPFEEYESIVEIQTEKLKITQVLTETDEEQNIHLGEGEVYYEYEDGSWAIADFGKNEFVFQDVDMGDWSIDVNSYEELMKVVYTYVDQTTQLEKGVE